MQAGDVPITYADTTPLEQDFGFRPHTPLRHGLRNFAQWYASYYGTNENSKQSPVTSQSRFGRCFSKSFENQFLMKDYRLVCYDDKESK